MDRMKVDALRMLEQRRRVLEASMPQPSRDSSTDAGSGEREGSIVERVRLELHAVEQAIDRIGRGTYGECAACGGAIGHQRLKAMPEAHRCLACAGGANVASAQDVRLTQR